MKKKANPAKKPMNPFEIHINKEKMRVLGKKLKHDRGLPGVSRAKAVQKRKHTLLQEYKHQNKSNRFLDKRIGEKNRQMTDEDKVMARFTAVRVKQHNRKSIFNLADDEVLTHRGQTLSEIEKFDDPRSDDESADEETGKLDREFVKEAHFGGGLFKNTGNEGVKSHKELIEQLIAESKKRKAEKQKTKEATLELTEKLDTDWKDLLPLVNKSRKTNDEPEVKKKVDDYDKVMRELRFEARGTVSDRLKTQDELAKEEKDKLEKLERERLDRMQGFVDELNTTCTTKGNHRSADDLDDDFVYDSDPEPEYMLSYNQQGESNVQVEAEINGKNVKAHEEDDEVEEADDSDEEELETEPEDNLSDLKEGNSDESEDETVPEKNTNEDIITNLQKRKEIMEKARKELPYTFNVPESYEELQKTLMYQSCHHQSVIIERMIKCKHPSLGQGNKDSLGLLFAYLLQYLNDLASEATDELSVKNCFDIFQALAPQIYDLAQLNSENAHNAILEVIKEKHGDFRKKSKTYPGLEMLIFFKLVSLLFTTSDFRHQVVTPCIVFLDQMLYKCRVRTKRDISYGLFVVALVLEYTSLSKRYLPASISFLSGLLYMAHNDNSKIASPFKSNDNRLLLINNCKNTRPSFKMQCGDLVGNQELTDDYKINVLATVLKMLEEFASNLSEIASNVEIFEPVYNNLLKISMENYPETVGNSCTSCLEKIKAFSSERKLEYVAMEAKKPKALRLYEPKIVEVYDFKKHKVQSKEKAARDKMLHKLKKEKKGALREIRRDQAFLGRVKIQQQIESDKKRKDKVKRIFAEASMQQSELNAIDRKRKRK